MSIVEIHLGLANASTMFMAILGLWAMFQFIRSQPLQGGWFGAAVIGEMLLLTQFALGWLLWFQGLGVALPRPFIHILYGVVAVISLPAGYAYFNSINQPKVQALAMAAICAFLWGITLRAAQVATLGAPY